MECTPRLGASRSVPRAYPRAEGLDQAPERLRAEVPAHELLHALLPVRGVVLDADRAEAGADLPREGQEVPEDEVRDARRERAELPLPERETSAWTGSQYASEHNTWRHV